MRGRRRRKFRRTSPRPSPPSPAAQAMFEVLTSVNRYALIYRTNAVKQASTRERKIAGFVEMLARRETPYPQKSKTAPRPLICRSGCQWAAVSGSWFLFPGAAHRVPGRLWCEWWRVVFDWQCQADIRGLVTA